MIKAITFDFWNTLYQAAPYAAGLRRKFLFEIFAKNQIDIDEGQVDAAEDVARKDWNRVWREEYRTPPAADWVRWMLDELLIQLPPADFNALADYYDRSLLDADPGPTLIDGAAKTVRRLAQRYRLGIISDSGLSTGTTLRQFLKRDEILGHFTCTTFSDEIGVSKPHARIFQLTLDRLGAQPHEAVHLGDLTHSDIAGAKTIGMQAVRLTANFDDANRSVEPDAVVNSYAEFELWLKSQDAPSGPPRYGEDTGRDEGYRMQEAAMRNIPSIETARLLLRPLTPSDLDDYTRLIFADAEVMRYLPKRDLAPRERAARTLMVFAEHWSQHGLGAWAVTDKVTGEFMGHCGLGPVPEAGEIEVLYSLGRIYWGQGIATEAARASVRFGFEHANLARLVAFAVPDNIGSRRVMEHLDFVYEKEAHYFGLDLVQYALAREHFRLDDSIFMLR